MAARQSTALAKWRRDALRRLVASRRETLAVLARLPEAEILKARTQDRWSVKDVLGHLLACDEETVRRFALIARGHGDRIHWFESMAYADRFNARTVARLHRLGLRALLRRMQRTRADLRTILLRNVKCIAHFLLPQQTQNPDPDRQSDEKQRRPGEQREDSAAARPSWRFHLAQVCRGNEHDDVLCLGFRCIGLGCRSQSGHRRQATRLHWSRTAKVDSHRYHPSRHSQL